MVDNDRIWKLPFWGKGVLAINVIEHMRRIKLSRCCIAKKRGRFIFLKLIAIRRPNVEWKQATKWSISKTFSLQQFWKTIAVNSHFLWIKTDNSYPYFKQMWQYGCKLSVGYSNIHEWILLYKQMVMRQWILNERFH